MAAAVDVDLRAPAAPVGAHPPVRALLVAVHRHRRRYRRVCELPCTTSRTDAGIAEGVTYSTSATMPCPAFKDSSFVYAAFYVRQLIPTGASLHPIKQNCGSIVRSSAIAGSGAEQEGWSATGLLGWRNLRRRGVQRGRRRRPG